MIEVKFKLPGPGGRKKRGLNTAAPRTAHELAPEPAGGRAEGFRLKLPPGLELGVSDAATQYMGGDFGHTWNNWYGRGYIKDGSDPSLMDGREKRKQDLALMRDMGIKSYRFSCEWAELEPEEGVFRADAFASLREDIVLMLAYGIKPLLTLHHFTNPMWFEERGGWENTDNLPYFLRFVEKTVRAMGHLVSDYITINEPNVYAANGYYTGVWPPGKKSMATALQVMSVMASAHIMSYKLIHDIRRRLGFDDTRVSFALHMRVFEPKSAINPVHRRAAKSMSKMFQLLPLKAMTLGEFSRPLKNFSRARRGLYCDFHALNYYTRSTVAGLSDGTRKNAAKNDLGWEIYPSGLIRCAAIMHELKELPIQITENGTCDNDDGFRSLYIYEHLSRVISSKLPIQRYFHWCFTDNFEWVEGKSAKFGLVAIDGESGARSVKKSGEFYSRIIMDGGVTNETYDKYIKGVKYRHR